MSETSESSPTGHPTDTPKGAGDVDPGLQAAEAQEKGELGQPPDPAQTAVAEGQAEPTPEPPLAVSNEEAARNYLEEQLHYHLPSHAEADRAIAIADYIAEKGSLPPEDWTPPETDKPAFTGGEVPVPGAAATAQAEAQKAFDEGAGIQPPKQPAPDAQEAVEAGVPAETTTAPAP